ncbi:MAG: hypothetical protein QXS10_07605 [Candidatus Bathyarchaeia archaeon]
MSAPKLSDVVEPSPLVEAYSTLTPGDYVGRLAPSLGMIMEHELYNREILISNEFLDTDTFLFITYLKPMADVLKTVNDGLNSLHEVPLAVSLDQEMGFGKTHFLTLLWHLYAQTYKWSEETLINSRALLSEVKESGYKRAVAERTLVLALDLISYPLGLDPYETIFESAAKLVELKRAPTEPDPGFLRSLKSLKPIEAARRLISHLNDTPLLIMIDEFYGGLYRAAEGGDEKIVESLVSLISFLKEVIDASRGRAKLVIIISSARQDAERWDKVSAMLQKRGLSRLVEAVNDLRDRLGRLKPIKLGQIEVEDVISILVKRLFKFKVDRREAALRLKGALKSVLADLLDKKSLNDFISKIERYYPFSPSLEHLIRKFLYPTFGADLPRSQHIRDLLKITASAISKLIRDGEWGGCSLIIPAHIPPEDIASVFGESKIASEWMRVYHSCRMVAERVDEAELKRLLLLILVSIYTKSVTTNITKLIDMLRSPKILSREEIEFRGSTVQDLVRMLAGGVPDTLLKRLSDALGYLEKMPYVNSTIYEGINYYIMSLVPGPVELLDSFIKEERRRAGLEAEDYRAITFYLEEHMTRQYSLSGYFQSFSDKKAPPKVILVDWDYISGKSEKPRFIDYLDQDAFTILVASPWSIAKRLLQGAKPQELGEEARSIVERFRNDILSRLNLFAIVVPEFRLEDQKELCEYIAQVNASANLTDYIKPKDIKEVRRRRLDVARRTPTYNLLRELYEDEKSFEDIMIEVMDAMLQKIDNYASRTAFAAIQNYTAKMISLFNTIIYYDPGSKSIKKDRLSISLGTIKDLRSLYGEIPSWIASAVSTKCGVKGVDDLRAALLDYVKNYAAKHKTGLLSWKRLEIDGKVIKSALSGGWPEIPLKPKSISIVETAIKSLGGSYAIADPEIHSIKISVEDLKIIVEPAIVSPPPSPPPELFDVVEVKGINNVMIGLTLVTNPQYSDRISAVSLRVDLRKKGLIDIRQCVREVFINLDINKVLNTYRNDVAESHLTVFLKEKMKKEEIIGMLRMVGMDERIVEFKRGGASQ